MHVHLYEWGCICRLESKYSPSILCILVHWYVYLHTQVRIAIFAEHPAQKCVSVYYVRMQNIR